MGERIPRIYFTFPSMLLHFPRCLTKESPISESPAFRLHHSPDMRRKPTSLEKSVLIEPRIVSFEFRRKKHGQKTRTDIFSQPSFCINKFSEEFIMTFLKHFKPPSCYHSKVASEF